MKQWPLTQAASTPGEKEERRKTSTTTRVSQTLMARFSPAGEIEMYHVQQPAAVQPLSTSKITSPSSPPTTMEGCRENLGRITRAA